MHLFARCGPFLRQRASGRPTFPVRCSCVAEGGLESLETAARLRFFSCPLPRGVRAQSGRDDPVAAFARSFACQSVKL